MSTISIKGLVKKYGTSIAVNGIDLDVAPGEFVALLGPSGCGKTTTLRCLAGLEVPAEGEIGIGDKIVFSGRTGTFVPPDRRNTGMVFQSYALWPHMTVGANVGYPLKLAKVDKQVARKRVVEILDRVHLADRIDQPATSLSGGQQQRIALARAMVSRPAVMLFDEPLSNLDAKLRLSMRNQIRELHDDFETTSVWVTHDQEEAIALADRVVVMNSGRVEQIGSPQELYTRPANEFVADFMGFQNIFPAQVVGVTSNELVVRLDHSMEMLTISDSTGRWKEGDTMSAAVRSPHVRVTAGASDDGRINGLVRRTSYLGSSMRVAVSVGDLEIESQVDEADFGRFGPDDLIVGSPVSLGVDRHSAIALAPMSTAKPRSSVDSAPARAIA